MASKKTEIDEKEIAASALNQHGFLLQQRVRAQIKLGSQSQSVNFPWVFEANEYPVESTDGSQTRIDFILCHKEQPGIKICCEVKRYYAKLRRWLFWGEDSSFRGQSPHQFYFEAFNLQQMSMRQYGHQIIEVNARDWPVFSYYQEARCDNKNGDSTAPKGSDAIEQALMQVIRGQNGLAREQVNYWTMQSSFSLFVPIVITTAQLWKVEFGVDKVCLQKGTLPPDALDLHEEKFVAVNYHGSQSFGVCRCSPHMSRGDFNPTSALQFDILRTIFIVQAQHINEFLQKLSYIVCDQNVLQKISNLRTCSAGNPKR
ncbi:MAG: hypothetical protein V1746_07630 [bacterium]